MSLKRSSPSGPTHRLLLAAALAGSCALSSGCKQAPAASAVAPPPAIEALRSRIEGEGIRVSELEALRDLREIPECPQARFRWRLHLAGDRSFVNVSRFDSSAEAKACETGFRGMALKGGSLAWERLRRDIAVRESWLVLFPPDRPSEQVRRQIVQAVEALE